MMSARKKCLCVSVCVFSTCQYKLRFPIQLAWVILAFPSSCSILVLDHESSSLLLININIILYYPFPLTLRYAMNQRKQKSKISKTLNRSDKLQHHIISRIKPKGTAEVV